MLNLVLAALCSANPDFTGSFWAHCSQMCVRAANSKEHELMIEYVWVHKKLLVNHQLGCCNENCQPQRACVQAPQPGDHSRKAAQLMVFVPLNQESVCSKIIPAATIKGGREGEIEINFWKLNDAFSFYNNHKQKTTKMFSGSKVSTCEYFF